MLTGLKAWKGLHEMQKNKGQLALKVTAFGSLKRACLQLSKNWMENLFFTAANIVSTMMSIKVKRPPIVNLFKQFKYMIHQY